MKYVVVGNGILGLAIAFRLARRAAPSDRIVVIGKRDRKGSATLAAAAMLNSFAEVEVGSLASELDRYRFDLSREAGRMWPEFDRELTEVSSASASASQWDGFENSGGFGTGTYLINNTAADDLDDENFDAIVAALTEYSEPFELVSPRDIPNYMPEQRHRATRAMHIPGEGWMNPRLMIEKLDAVLVCFENVSFANENAVRLERSGQAVVAAIVESGERIEGDSFVLATGASTTALMGASNLDIHMQRIFYGVGVSVEIRSPDFPHTKCVRTPNRGLACGIYSVPYATQKGKPADHVLIGASNFMSAVPYDCGRLTSVESLMRGGIEQLNANFYRADLVRVNVGWRPTSQDTYPLLGRSSISNLFVATGTKRDGFHLAPLISQKIVALMFGQEVEANFSWFDPERKPLRTLGRQQAVDKAVRHQMSAAYQHGFEPAKNRMPAQVAQMFRDQVEALHDKVGATDWGIPPEMLDMYRYGHAVP
jgi:glycine oxidase